MITERDLQEAIAKCNGKVDPSPDDAILMAACMVIRDHWFSDLCEEESPQMDGYSTAAPAEQPEKTIHINSGTEFSQAISGLSQDDGWAIMDELMETLRALHPRLYNGVIRKIRG